MWNLKNGSNELIYKTEIRVIDVENKLMVTRGWVGGLGRGINWESAIDIYTLLYIK